MKKNDETSAIVGEPVKIFVSIPCIDCREYFEIQLNADMEIGPVVVECPRCGGVHRTWEIGKYPIRIVREN